MKDKENQIEEMAKEIEHAKQGIWASVITREEDEDYLWHSRRIAKHLTGVGYQKVDKDSVVMSKEYYDYLINDCICWEKLAVEKVEQFKQARKETAREILHKIYEDLSKYEAVNEIDYDCWVDDVLYEISKQYGVEIKE